MPLLNHRKPHWSCLLIIAWMLTMTGNGTAEGLSYQSRPAELAVFACTPHSVRIALAPASGKKPAELMPSPVFATRTWSPAGARWQTLDGPEAKQVGKWTVRVTPDPLTVTVVAADGMAIQTLTLDRAMAGFTFRTGKQAILGLGEGGSQFDRRGKEFPLLNGQRTPDRATHGARIAVPYLLGTEGWAIFVVSSPGSFDLRSEEGNFRPPADGAPAGLDVIVADARDPEAWVREMADLTGPAALPPKWALGYMQSHRTLKDADQMLAVADTFREKKLPCDALIYLGTGFCPAGWNQGHDSLEFNPAVFKRPPAEVIADLHARNFKVVVHVTPPAVERIPAPSGKPWDDLRYSWDGGSLRGSFTDPPEARRDPTHIAAYWDRHEAAFAAGIDGWWPDEGDWLDVESRFARARLYYEGPISARPDRRPWNLQRNGYTGVARYGGWIWSGDVESRWAALKAQVPVGINHSLSVSPFWGTDTGGFHPSPELTGELMVRWFQFSAFCPSFRSHGRAWQLRLPWGWSDKNPGALEGAKPPSPGELPNPRVETICRQYLELRYRLLPYTYTLARQARDTGLPLMRALWLHYPRDSRASATGDAYLWGREILVAPVVERGAATRTVHLPAGRWFDWWTGESMEGGRDVSRPVDLATLPLYVRAGAIIPLDPVRQYAMEPVDGPTTLAVHAGADGSFTLYEDEGENLAYEKGASATIPFRWDDKARALTIEAREGSFPGLRKERVFRVNRVRPGHGTGSDPAGPPDAEIRYNGTKVSIELPDR